ncbi:uncharacterized protein J3R85_003360 [Psidium guajava]|nr:uncharacterized protein J3R85_003360 [Psidium guajava]
MRGRDVRLMVEKELSATNRNPGRSRLSLPKSQVLTEFLSDQEIRTLDSKEGIKVSLVDVLLLKKWSYSSKTFFLCADRAGERGRAAAQEEWTKKGRSRPALVFWMATFAFASQRLRNHQPERLEVESVASLTNDLRV